MSKYTKILFEKRDRVGLITLNKPEALNALCDTLILELTDCCLECNNDADIGAIVITGSVKAFAAGADIKQMSSMTFVKSLSAQNLPGWEKFNQVKIPIIGAVNGFALGGGLELALTCDVLYAGNKAKFGQVEVTVGTIPGCGGSQRLIREIGKSRAMEMSLSGELMMADEALSRGLVSKVFEPEVQVEKAVEQGNKIANYSKVTTIMVKDVINKAYELPMAQGLAYEKQMFNVTFGTNDQKIGMGAFIDKTKPVWTHS